MGDWLRSLGLGQYLDLFREHAIDADVLADLTEPDLEKIGVPLGHRKKLTKAIAALALAAAPSPAERASEPLAPPAPRADAERRHVAVLFCDLVGSTSLSAALDAEDWRNLVNAYLDAASAAVTQMGGHVLKKLGDGLMALFGYPVAQENDSERAVRAALAIQRALGELNRKGQASGAPELAARIGVETGAVIVDSSGEVFGDAPNVAARVQALAEPGTVLITAKVQRQVAGLFVAEDRGAHALKGASEPVMLYRIVRASGGGRRSGQRALTPLVGRDEEVTMLIRRWERARQGEGQFVMIVGEPGLGKSRLIEEFHGRLRDTPHTWVEWSASQLLQNTPLPRSPNGAGSASAAPTRRPSGGSPNSKARSPRSSSTRPNMSRCSRRLSTCRFRPSAPRRWRRMNCAAGRWRRSTPGSPRARAPRRSCSRSRTCIGPIRPRSTSCAASLSAAR
ncbi:MAG: adenylate/guanylate cyclase domain-containing protein [Roseiarcus sp.]